ncbi:jg25957 [Pararge aegeria aegeria]|uniref:Jg25957 protein n=2 Tax=Pararge aegeria TaxID=116150 RepID=A0A8S4QUG8_9NEOP|nr:jg25957 [Pararge aegeria aegeria]
MCRLSGYIEATLWCVSVYSFMWISVDRYQAIRKPLRYETFQTRARGQCWMVFSWMCAATLCCPPLFANQKKDNFDSDTLVCMLDWGTTSAYTLTLGILVLGPSIISIVYNYLYIICKRRKLYSGSLNKDKEYASALAENLANPNQKVSFILVLTFWLSWTPYAIVCLYEYIGEEKKSPMVHFAVVWIGVLNSCWKFVVLLPLSPEFRLAFKLLCKSLCCRSKVRLDGDGGMMNADCEMLE